MFNIEIIMKLIPYNRFQID
ncbi:hypothetical protein VCHENC02_3651A, partial [Vibrio harveyi]